MGLVNARNLRKAKELLEKNRHKVGDVVGKAATKLDTVSGGKTANISKKAEDAARKYSAAGAADIGTHAGVVSDASGTGDHPAPPIPQAAVSAEEMRLRQTEANIAAANALTAAANEMLQQAAEMHAHAAGEVPTPNPPTANPPTPFPSAPSPSAPSPSAPSPSAPSPSAPSPSAQNEQPGS